MFDFSDQVVVITGGSGNLGRAVTQVFLAAGAHVVPVDHGQGKLAQLFPALVDAGEHWLASGFDLTQPADTQRLLAGVLERFGRVDVLVNAAGGFRADGPVHEMSLATLDGMFNLNARTVFLTSQAAIPSMLAQGSGKIINVAAKKGLTGAKNSAGYSVAKSAVIRLTESMAHELRVAGINVNCVLPNIIDTPENRASMPDADAEQWVTPQSLADVIMFLASAAARDIHGAAIPVYGQS